MAETKVRVAILGHSFVRRLNDDFLHNVLPSNYDLRECLVMHSGLGGFLACKDYEGVGNCTSNFIKRFDMFLRGHRPQVVILQMGENDIDSKVLSISIASTLEEIGLLLLKDYDVRSVVICELFTRLKPKHLLQENYEIKRRQTNQILKTLLESHQHIRFWSHRRIFGTQQQIFTHDGIHLSPFGQGRFYRSLRHAVMTAIRQTP